MAVEKLLGIASTAYSKVMGIAVANFSKILGITHSVLTGGVYYNSVDTKLLLPTLGDQGNTGHEVTVKGTPIIKSFNAEGNEIVNYSGYFNGTDGYLTVPDHADFTLGSGDFCIEFFVYRTDDSINHGIAGQLASGASTSDTSWYIYIQSTGEVYCRVSDASTAKNLISTTTFGLNEWHHVAIVRDGNTLYCYIDGVQDTTTLDVTGYTLSDKGTPVTVGRLGDYVASSITWHEGYLTGFAIHTGVTVYDATFTPQKTISQMTNDSNTVLFLDFTEIDQGEEPTYFTDTATNATGGLVTNNNVTGCTYWWDGAWEFDGSTDYLTVPDHADWDFGTTLMTCSFWVLLTSDTGVSQVICQFWGSDSARWGILVNATTNLIYFFTNTGSSDNESVSFTYEIGKMYHIEISKNSSDIRFFVDGTQIGSTQTNTQNLTTLSGALSIGARVLSSTWDLFLEGYLSELKITNSAGNTTTFTPPTAPAVSDANTKLLLQPSGNTAIGGENHDVTFSDGVILSQEADTDFVSSYEFDGTGDFIEIADSANFDIVGSATDDQTIDFRVKFADHAGTETLVCQYEAAGEYWALEHVHGTGLQFRVVSTVATGFTTVLGAEITDTLWHHIALIKVNQQWAIYIDGERLSLISNSETDTLAGVLRFGALSASNYFEGWMSEIRINDNNDFNVVLNSNDTDTVLLTDSQGDQGSTGHEVTVKGTPILKSFNAEGNEIVNYSGHFNGTNSYCEVSTHADFDVSSTDLTCEMWFHLTDNDIGVLFSIGNADYNVVTSYYDTNGKITLIASTDGSSWTVFEVGATAVPTGVWHHLAAVFNSSGVKVYLNGSLYLSDATDPSLYNLTNFTFRLGAHYDLDAAYFISGYVCALAVHHSANIYTTTFTPPKSIAEMTNDANTVLFLDFTDAVQGTAPATFDSTAVGETIAHVVTNTSTNVTGCTFWWDGAWDFDGSTDYLTTPNFFDPGTGPWTIDLWGFFDTITTAEYGYLIADYESAGGADRAWYLNKFATTNKLKFVMRNPAGDTELVNMDSDSAMVAGRWYHVALVHDGTDITMYVDGTAQADTATPGATLGYSSNDLMIGGYWNAGATNVNATGTGWPITGKLAGVRFSDVDRTITSAELVAPAVSDSNTKLLLQPKGNTALGGSHDLTFTDGTILPAFNANEIVNYSGFFNASTSALTIPQHTDFQFGANPFTIEFYFMLNTIDSAKNVKIASDWEQSGNRVWHISKQLTSNKIIFDCRDSGASVIADILSDDAMVVNRWYHLAVVRDSSDDFYMYIDGVQQADTSNSSTSIVVGAHAVLVGAQWETAGGDSTITAVDADESNMDGYISGLAVHKGVALYTTDFTPPKTIAEMTNNSNTVLLIDFTNLTHGGTEDPVDTSASTTTHVITNFTDKVEGCHFHWQNPIQFDGTADFINLDDSTDFDLIASITQDYTIDLWLQLDDPTTGTTTETIICQYEDASNYWAFEYLRGTGLQFRVVSAVATTFTTVTETTIFDTLWHHVALVKKDNVYTIYLDGVGGTPVTETETDTFITTVIARLGALSASDYLEGSISALRVSKVAIWADDFIPPVAPYEVSELVVPTIPYDVE